MPFFNLPTRLALPVLFFVSSILEKIGLPARIGNDFTYYGQWYGPVWGIYYVVKKRWAEQDQYYNPRLPR
ncbi:hypothetical protein CYMTET_11807 [Cymbomonas tetramitiformis]|uniref:Uncharacterized protein n=1 Tax=Cymbomonas tetramitiformis TaxID=36881 RepID=A0AAE0LCH3_9CHLO|nr:hypothetical protein CYMTET_11807 [Cymbomonas tetramitiformis]